jgi:Lrp/AsnC family transcriptional regulator for asnA, asnC and gidA
VGFMDELDKKIISELNKDSRLSFRELSKNLNIAVGTISHRIKKMEEDGIIKGYIPVVEPSKAGYDLIAVINVTIKRGKLQDVASLLDKFNNIVSIYNVTGNYDAVIIARFKNRGQLNNFVKELQTFENVDKTNTSLVLNTIKEDIRVKFD